MARINCEGKFMEKLYLLKGEKRDFNPISSNKGSSLCDTFTLVKNASL